MEDEYIYPFILGTGFGSTLSPAHDDVKEKRKKPRIGFHVPKKVKSNGRRTP